MANVGAVPGTTLKKLSCGVRRRYLYLYTYLLLLECIENLKAIQTISSPIPGEIQYLVSLGGYNENSHIGDRTYERPVARRTPYL
ncbi:hypothetical protein DPMN_022045 [Dreissena polymorpha]|uniref:Uncharacterized protein n=1 Tax=Dreissena polymorpha TaxID=45954 RepID=A0A9D4NPV3_DREPO|nr:hypothetical protein DPMN_022045 [Dreissena polymorpha]